MGVNWSHKQEAWSWVLFFFGPLLGVTCMFVMPFALAHPVAFKVLLLVVPSTFVLWLIVLAMRSKKSKDRGND